MKHLGREKPRLRLDPENYGKLRLKVLERDGWRCQFCGSMQNLQVHHQQLRSGSGPDTAENLTTLCASCHLKVHGRLRDQYFT